jgi:hypothetical protein
MKGVECSRISPRYSFREILSRGIKAGEVEVELEVEDGGGEGI